MRWHLEAVPSVFRINKTRAQVYCGKNDGDAKEEEFGKKMSKMPVQGKFSLN